jgi:hypothetical protein
MIIWKNVQTFYDNIKNYFKLFSGKIFRVDLDHVLQMLKTKKKNYKILQCFNFVTGTIHLILLDLRTINHIILAIIGK